VANLFYFEQIGVNFSCAFGLVVVHVLEFWHRFSFRLRRSLTVLAETAVPVATKT